MIIQATDGLIDNMDPSQVGEIVNKYYKEGTNQIEDVEGLAREIANKAYRYSLDE